MERASSSGTVNRLHISSLSPVSRSKASPDMYVVPTKEFSLMTASVTKNSVQKYSTRSEVADM